MIFCDMFSSLVIRANLLGTTLAAKNIVDSFLVISTASLALVQIISPFTDSFMDFIVPISTQVFRFLSILCTSTAIDEDPSDYFRGLYKGNKEESLAVVVEKASDAASEVVINQGEGSKQSSGDIDEKSKGSNSLQFPTFSDFKSVVKSFGAEISPHNNKISPALQT